MKLFLLFVLVFSVMVGCSQNNPWRTLEPAECLTNEHDESLTGCKESYLEIHKNYDLGFVEYSERGNLFDLERTKKLYEHIEEKSNNGGVAVIVFVHGWKHNAESNDSNVIDFRRALERVSSQIERTTPHLVGLYVGWRGKSIQVPILKEATFWDRKAVAIEVGKGGVTDFFLKLENIINVSKNDNNIFLVVGHSFGGAIVLSALNDVFLTRLRTAEKNEESKLVPFGDSVIVLNPAIEANQIFQLKEMSMKLGKSCKLRIDSDNGMCERVEYPTMLHVISSRGDKATKYAFPVGQFFGTSLSWSQRKISRTYETNSGERKNYVVSEYDFDTTTIGNLELFHTASLVQLSEKSSQYEKDTSSQEKAFFLPNPDPGDELVEWQYKSYCKESSDKHFPCLNTEPISFLTTEKSFINSHSDIFNDNVISYVSTIISESFYRRYFARCLESKKNNNCKNSFIFENIFANHYRYYKQH